METLGCRWLVAVVQGVAAEDLELGETPALAAELASPHGVRRLEIPAGRPPVDSLSDALRADDLRAAGATVDRRSIVLRAAWQSDASVLHGLCRHAGGPADLTLLWLGDVSRIATRAGLATPAHRAALATLERGLQRAAATLAADRSVVRVVLTVAPLHPVDRWFDPQALLARALPRGANGVDVAACLAHATVRCASMQSTAAVTDALARTGLTEHGDLLGPDELATLGMTSRPGEIVLRARPGIAFSRWPVRAAPRLGTDRSGCAIVPWLSARQPSISLAHLAMALRQQVLAGTAAVADRAVDRGSVDDAPDLLPLLRAAAAARGDSDAQVRAVWTGLLSALPATLRRGLRRGRTNRRARVPRTSSAVEKPGRIHRLPAFLLTDPPRNPRTWTARLPWRRLLAIARAVRV
jgi:hypothetical protein